MSKNNRQPEGSEGARHGWNRIDPAAASDGDIQRVHDELVHEKETPSEGFSPVPIFLVLLISALIVFCGIYMVWRSDDFDQLGYDETRRRFAWEATEDGAAAAGPPGPQVGQRLFNQNCAMCHQQSGQGTPGVFPPLDGVSWVVGNEERVIAIVMNGLTGPIEVNGETFNGVMPAFDRLSDEELAGVISYIRQSWTNDAEPVTPDQVARVRQGAAQRGSPWTVDELEQEFPE